MCFTTEVWKKRCFPFKNALLFPLPIQYNQKRKSEEIAGSSFQHCRGSVGEVRRRVGKSAKSRACQVILAEFSDNLKLTDLTTLNGPN